MTDAEHKMHKALTALYIAVEKGVADDVNAKVRARVEELEDALDRALKLATGSGADFTWEAVEEIRQLRGMVGR